MPDEDADFDLTKRFPATHPSRANRLLEFRTHRAFALDPPRREAMAVGQYTKAIAAAVVAGMTAAITALQDGNLEPWEWATVAGAFLAALGLVWAIPNVPDSVRIYGKAITSGLVSAAASAGVALLDRDVSSTEALTIAIALISGLGLVAIAPNAIESDDPPQPGGDPVDDGEPVEEGYDSNDLPSDNPADHRPGAGDSFPV